MEGLLGKVGNSNCIFGVFDVGLFIYSCIRTYCMKKGATMKEAFEKIKKLLSERGTQQYEYVPVLHETVLGRKIIAVEKALEIVSEVEAEYGNGWIDVKDRLPENDGYYLTCDHKGNIHIFFHHQEFKETAPFGICEHHSRYYQPIAWMELPKPYIGKKGV